MKKLTVLFLLVAFFALSGFAQTSDIPERVNVSLDALLKTRTSNQVFNMESVNSYFYVLQGAVYTNVLFKADLSADAMELKAKLEASYEKNMAVYNAFVEKEEAKIEEANKKIREKNKSLQTSKQVPEKTWVKPEAPKLNPRSVYHNIYVRVVKDGVLQQKFKAPMPAETKKDAEYYSFGLILEPGKYDLLVNVNRYDDTQDGTLLIEVDVPKMTVTDLITPTKEIQIATPVFYKEISTLHQVDNRFNVVSDKYQITPSKQELTPYIDAAYQFNVSEIPTLTFFILGVPQPWNVEVKMDVMQGKKKIVTFKVPPMQNPYFFQTIAFKKGKSLLEPGDYVLKISLIDNNKKSRKGKVEVPFKLVK